MLRHPMVSDPSTVRVPPLRLNKNLVPDLRRSGVGRPHNAGNHAEITMVVAHQQIIRHEDGKAASG